MILYREILGGITDSLYIKPRASYRITTGFHVLHQRTWECGYGWGCDNSAAWAQSWNVGSYEDPFIAFKESWANLVAQATFEEK